MFSFVRFAASSVSPVVATQLSRLTVSPRQPIFSPGVDRRDALRLTELEAELAALRAQRDDLTARVNKQQSEVRTPKGS